jgi:glycosyltransferase involved in cell wall biosynthesis
VSERENQITNLERQQNIINAELFRMNSDAATFGAKIGRGITRLRARIAPVGTRRGQIVSLSGKFVSKLFSNGLKNTILHTFSYISLQLRFKLPGRFLGERADARRDFIETSPENLSKTQGDIQTDHPQLASWIAAQEPHRDQLASQKVEANQFKYRPLISVIIPIYRVPREVLIETLECLTEQTYPNWQACIVWADSENLAGWEWFKEKVNTDRRFKIKYLEQNGGISKNSNAALELAEGEYVALLDHDDVLSPWAFYEVVRLLQSSPQLDFIYSDKNSITADGKFRLNALFKPEWSPEMLHSVNFLTHLNIIRTRLLREIDGWDSETDGAQDWDLFFRLTERTKNIARLPSILYHWRILPTSTASGLQAKPYAAMGQLKTQQNHFKRMGLSAAVMPTPEGLFHVNWPVQPLSTDVVIYQTGSLAQLINVLDLLRAGKQEAIRNIYVLHSSPSSDALLAFQLVWGDRFVLVPCTSVNWRAALMATVEYNDRRAVLLLDGSAVGMSADLVEELAGWVTQHPDISWSSAIAMNADGTVYEAGRVVASDYQSAPMFNGSPLYSFGWFGGPLWYRNAQAASPYAVAMNARDIELALSGIDEAMEQEPSFAQFCLSLTSNGRRGLIDPFAKVYFDKPPESHWPNHGPLYHSDPYFNPAFEQVSPLRLQQ